MKHKILSKLLVCGAICLTGIVAGASDHDDGETDQKSRTLNFTDLYIFKESSQIAGGSNAHLVFVMNTNPRSLPRQQYYYSTNARYDFRITRVGTNNATPVTAQEDIVLRFEFLPPDAATKQQDVKVTVIKDGVATVKTTTDAGGNIKTTTVAAGAAPVNNAVTIDGNVLNIFAGLREDPFFFDVTAFFKFRATGAGYPAASPTDFTANYNVNSIVVRVPISYLQKSGETVFDTWAAITVPKTN